MQVSRVKCGMVLLNIASDSSCTKPYSIFRNSENVYITLNISLGLYTQF